MRETSEKLRARRWAGWEDNHMTCAETAFHSRKRLFTSLVMCFSLVSTPRVISLCSYGRLCSEKIFISLPQFLVCVGKSSVTEWKIHVPVIFLFLLKLFHQHNFLSSQRIKGQLLLGLFSFTNLAVNLEEIL